MKKIYLINEDNGAVRLEIDYNEGDDLQQLFLDKCREFGYDPFEHYLSKRAYIKKTNWTLISDEEIAKLNDRCHGAWDGCIFDSDLFDREYKCIVRERGYYKPLLNKKWEDFLNEKKIKI